MEVKWFEETMIFVDGKWCEYLEWRRVNDEPFEYAIRQGPIGDEFVKLPDGSCLRRPLSENQLTKQKLEAPNPVGG